MRIIFDHISNQGAFYAEVVTSSGSDNVMIVEEMTAQAYVVGFLIDEEYHPDENLSLI